MSISFLFYYISKSTIHPKIKILALDELKFHISLSLILHGTSVKGVLTLILFQGRGMFQCQERRALPKALGDKGAGPECSEGLRPLP